MADAFLPAGWGIAERGEELRLSPNAVKVLNARYLRQDSEGRIIETPVQLFKRVADAVAAVEQVWPDGGGAERWRYEILRLMTSLEFLPDSPVLMKSGTVLGQLNACFVVPVPDTIEGIFDALRTMALIQRSGRGTGFSFSRLRPAATWSVRRAGGPPVRCPSSGSSIAPRRTSGRAAGVAAQRWESCGSIIPISANSSRRSATAFRWKTLICRWVLRTRS